MMPLTKLSSTYTDDARFHRGQRFTLPRIRIKKILRLLTVCCASLLGILGFINRASSSAPPPTFAAPVSYATGSQPHTVVEYLQPTFPNEQQPALAVTNNASNTVSLFVRFGSGPYSLYDTVQLSPGSDAQKIVASPGLAGDRFLAVAASGINAVTVFSVFGTIPENYPVGVYPEAVVTGDFNLDGREDIAASNYGDGTVSVLLRSGLIFQTAVSYPAGPGPEDIVSGDFNGDGKPDLAVCNSGDNKARVFFGNGDGTFQPFVAYNVGTIPYFLITADFDGNAKLDLAVANHVSNDISILLNNGNGTFQSAANYPAGVGIRSLSSADFDLDGIRDLVVASPGDNTIRVLINNGNGTFQLPLAFASGPSPHAALAGEFNGDGRPDVVVPNNSAATISVLSNTSPPPNDHFMNGRGITGTSGATSGANGGASKESGEPNHAGNAGGRSVWFRYQPPNEGVATISTLGSSFDTTLAVYTGSSVDSLTLIGSNQVGLFRRSSVSFRAHANTTYHIAVDGFDGVQGSIVLNWTLGSLLPNDDFDPGQLLTGNTGSVTSTNVGTSKELGEPNHAGNQGGTSVWYTWHANNNGPVTFTTEGSDFNTLLAAYTGTTVSALTPVSANDDYISFSCFSSSITFNATAGTTYHIAVDGSFGQTGAISLTWGPPPANDSFNNFVSLPNASGTLGGTTQFATTEPDEPPTGLIRSVWYRWQPPLTGAASISVSGGKSVFVYTGATLSSLVLITSSSTTVNFSVSSGTTYQIAVMNGCGLSGAFSLDWNTQPPPSNDSFANRTVINGEFGTQNGNSIGASKELNEPNHAGNSGGRSIWYRWEAPSTGSFTFTTLGSEFNTLLAAYTGSSVDALSEVASNNDDALMICNPTRSRMTFNAVAGTIYQIAIDGAGGASGNTFLRWGKSATVSGTVTSPIVVDLSGGVCLRSGGTFSFQNVPTGANYSVSASDGIPSDQFRAYGFSGSMTPLTGDVSGIRFIQITPTYTASGTVIINNGTLDGVSVTCALIHDVLTEVNPAIINLVDGNWSCGGLWSGSRYRITPSKANFTFQPPSTETTGNSGGGLFQGSPIPTTVQFTAATYNVSEGGGAVSIGVSRTGDTSGTSTVNFTTSDTAGLNNCSLVNGVASARCDYITSVSTVRFAAGENAKSISIPIVDDAYAEGNENFTITLSNASGATLGSANTATIGIQDNEASNGPNPVDGTAFFVRQQYLDFLNREPDPAGYAAWQAEINGCPPGATTCDRIHVSSGFFRSAEFSERGYFIYRFYPVSFGRKPVYTEFIPDMAKVSGFLTDAELEAARVAFVNEFVTRSEFTTKYGGLNNPQFVDTLLSTAGITHPNRDSWIASLNATTKTRAQVLREIAETTQVFDKFFNEAFVVMQYFGYLRREPDAQFLVWITELNTTGNFRNMINGFMNSLEYRNRFGPTPNP